jgi:transposase-like protein
MKVARALSLSAILCERAILNPSTVSRGQKYPTVAQSWRRNWEQVIPFFAFAPEVRKIIYTTNAIESLDSQVRKSIRNKGRFSSDESVLKLIWLLLRYITGVEGSTDCLVTS